MATRTSREKVDCTVELLMGLRHREVREALAPHDLSAETIREGWKLVERAGLARLENEAPRLSPKGPANFLREMEEFQSLWFPIARATLKAHFPWVAEAFFVGLTQQRGHFAPFALSHFLVRLSEIEQEYPIYEGNGQNARRLLEKRGLTKAVEEHGHKLSDSWGKKPPAPLSEDAALAAEEAAIAEVWNFYLEWSGIALSVLTNPAHLRWLGLNESSAKRKRRIKVELRAQRAQPLPGESPTLVGPSSNESGTSGHAESFGP